MLQEGMRTGLQTTRDHSVDLLQRLARVPLEGILQVGRLKYLQKAEEMSDTRPCSSIR